MLRHMLPNKEDRAKYFNFIRNVGLANIARFPGGAAAAELANIFTDNSFTIGLASAIGSHAATAGVFYTLHIIDNKDIYKNEKGRFRLPEFIKDQIKLSIGFSPLYLLYWFGKPLLTSYFIKKGANLALASFYADAICIPTIAALSAPIAKLTGNIRVKKQTLNDSV